ncbi:PREDICTED: fibrillin-1-like, partial [Branchiostoma belcheri]|uniref:Fibrillin-1-like n=1 Tax=Branchiostoma belcheri TaxID=7741 RepID=A0A6P4ZN25_BRABE
MTYSQARQVCIDNGGSLAMIKNSEINSFVKTLPSDHKWFGLTDEVTEVTVQECPTLNAPPNGAVSGDNVLTFTCNTGYNLVGPSTLTCQRDGTWSGSPPTCEAVQCPTLSNPTNGDVSYSTRYYGDVASYLCDTGYSLNGYSTRTCQSSGSWSQSAPTCEVGQCPTLTSPVNGAVSGSNGYGGTLTFTCNTGYNLVGSSTLTCQSDLTWSGSSPTCSIVQCPLLAAPDNGGKTGGNSYQDVVTFSCNLGYDLVGSSSLTCRADASWSGSAPTCSRVQCAVPSSPVNGDSSGPNFYQDVVQFTCDQGYDLVGYSSSTCQADRTWSSNVPSCNDIDECSAANGGCDHVCTNTMGSFQCSCVDGFTLNLDSHSCDDRDECAVGNAGCHHNCNNIIGSYWCSCGSGYRINGDGHSCDDVNECYNGNGGCGQTCTNLIGSFQCSCQNGYRLDSDGFTCNDVNECASTNGGCEQTCRNNIGSFQCSCGAGYNLDGNGFTCNDVNECGTANGGCDQDCTNSRGSFQCSCDIGYDLNGDGFSCVDVDECETANGGCGQICNNTIGSFECFCRTGYILHVDGLACNDIDECDTASGGCGQFCTNTIGSFNCFCATGYNLSMDGLTCDELPPPTNFTFCQVTENSATVQWTKPVDALVVAYKVWLTEEETALTVSRKYLLDSATSTIFTFLTPATEYVVAVTCISPSVEGLQASVTIVTDTDPPGQLSVDDIGYTSLGLSWIPPVAKLTEYELTYSRAEHSRTRRSLNVFILPGDVGNYWLQELLPATKYVISLTAVSRFGRSDTINTTVITGTDPPIHIEIRNISSTWMTVTWTAPVATVVSYDLTVTDATTMAKKHF